MKAGKHRYDSVDEAHVSFHWRERHVSYTRPCGRRNKRNMVRFQEGNMNGRCNSVLWR